MTGRTQLDPVPEWVIAEMPPGYRTRLLEIERLAADLTILTIGYLIGSIQGIVVATLAVALKTFNRERIASS